MRLMLGLASAFLLSSLSHAQVPPEKAEATFKVAAGMEFKLWAAEPMFSNPTCIDVDHRGRVWVCEAVNYRCTLHKKPLNRAEGDRIVILEDAKGQGRADTVKVFAQAPYIRAPLGIAVLKDADGPGQKVFVAQSPDILIFDDKDGDDKADGPPRKLLTGFNGIDHDHGVHGLVFGPDGKLYFTVGDQGVKNLQSSDGTGRKWTTNHTDCQAGTVWRCDLDGKNLELIAHNFRNNYEPAIDSFGTIFTSDNDDDGNQQCRICYVMPGGNYGYWPRGKGESHWHEECPGIVPKVLRTGFGSPCGMCFYEGTLLPKKYMGQLLHVDAGPREVRCYHMKPKGAGYELETEVLVSSTDNWFRPSDICVAPDGSVFVSDWYDPGVGGHGMGDTTRGRIYRLAPIKTAKARFNNIPPITPVDCFTALCSPSISTWMMGRQLLLQHAMRDPMASNVFKPVKDTFAQAVELGFGVTFTGRVMYLAEEVGIGLKGPQNQLMFAACKQDFVDIIFKRDPDRSAELIVRINEQMLHTRISDRLRNEINSTLPSLSTLTQGPVSDSWIRSLTIRSSCEILLSKRNDDPHEQRALALRALLPRLAKAYDGNDPFYLAALNIACGTDSKRREVILADFEKHFPNWDDRTAKLVRELRPPTVMAKLPARLADESIPVPQRLQIAEILACGDVEAGRSLLKHLPVEKSEVVRAQILQSLGQFLPSKWRTLAKTPELTAAIKSCLAKPDTQLAALRLIAATENVKAVAQVLPLIDVSVAKPTRVAAIEALGTVPSDEAAQSLVNLLPKEKEAEVVKATANALAKFIDRKNGAGQGVALRALQGLVNDGNSVGLQALAQTRAGTNWLLSELAKDKLAAALKPEALKLVRNSPFQDLRNKALVLAQAPAKLDPKKLPEPRVLAERKGDAKNGEKLYLASLTGEAQCMKCHSVRGAGGAIGPDLSVIGLKASKENLYESILQPSKAVADQYAQWNVVTGAGKPISGLLIQENDKELLIRDANGVDHKIAVKDVESKQKSATSLMADNLVNTLTEAELTDMVEYLATLKQFSFTPEKWKVVGPLAVASAERGLDEALPVEGEPTLGEAAKPYAAKAQGYFDLKPLFGDKVIPAAGYLEVRFISPTAQDVKLLLGAAGPAKVWLNGQPVVQGANTAKAVPWNVTAETKLKRGPNTLRIKVVRAGPDVGVYFAAVANQALVPLP